SEQGMSVTNTSHYYSPDPSHAWCRSGRAAVCAGPLEPGEWMDTLVSSLLRSAPLLLNARAPAQEPATGHWRIETGKTSPTIHYLPASEGEFRFWRDRTSATRLDEGIEGDKRALALFWAAFPGRRPRVALYAGLPPLPPTDRLAAVADELAGRGLCVRLLAHG